MRHERKAPAKERKVDTDINASPDKIQAAISAQKKKEKNRVSLRIDSRTVILVPKSKCNKVYADEYRNRMQESQAGATYNYINNGK